MSSLQFFIVPSSLPSFLPSSLSLSLSVSLLTFGLFSICSYFVYPRLNGHLCFTSTWNGGHSSQGTHRLKNETMVWNQKLLAVTGAATDDLLVCRAQKSEGHFHGPVQSEIGDLEQGQQEWKLNESVFIGKLLLAASHHGPGYLLNTQKSLEDLMTKSGYFP